MKKIYTILALCAVVLTASAQKSVQGSRFFDNWSIGLVGGGITPMEKTHFLKNVRATYGVEVTKQITPIFGLGVQYLLNNNTTESKNIIDQQNLSLLGKFNLSNAFCGFKDEPRLFEVEAVAGIGWGHGFYPSNYKADNNFVTTTAGLNFNFNLGADKEWTVALKPSVVYNMNNDKNNAFKEFNFNRHYGAFQLLAGVTYHFKNKSNGHHHMTLVKAYDQAEIDALNSTINGLRGQVSDKDAQIANQNKAIADLQQALNDCRNQKPATEVKTVTKESQSLESTITFRQGKSTVDASQLPNVERVATFLKNHKDASVSIKGYASPEGSAEVNAKIAKARAEAVKTILVNKYKIASSRISAEGQGVGNMFSEPDWNRVSICTIEESK